MNGSNGAVILIFAVAFVVCQVIEPGGAVALMDKPAHPNAAKVLINWLLSREGQIAMQRDPESAGRNDSLRTDIPKTDVHPMMRRREASKYIVMWNPEWMDMKPVQDVVNQALEEAKRK